MSENNIDLGVEQFLAAVLHKVGPVEMNMTDLMQDYSQYAVAIDPVGDNESLRISLVDLQGANLEDVAE